MTSPSSPDSAFHYSYILFTALLQDFLHLGPPLLPYSSVSRKVNYLAGGQQPLVVDQEELLVVAQLFSTVQLFATLGLQHVRLPCLSLFPRACSNSCPLSWWCHPTISSSISPFSSCLQSFPASGSFLMLALLIRWPKYQSFSVRDSNEYSGLISFSIDWFDLLAVQGTLKSLLQHHDSKASIFGSQLSR